MASYSVRLWSRNENKGGLVVSRGLLVLQRQDIVNRKEGEVGRRRGGKIILKSRQGCTLPADLEQLKQDRLKRGCCEVICGTPTTLRGYGITQK